MERVDQSMLPDSQSYLARDKCTLYYRHYPANTDQVMILLHGISEDGKYLHPLANMISTQNLAHVYTPDLRGYGNHPARRGDLDYIGQIEDDLADFIQWIKEKQPHTQIILAGHSAGGGTVIRFAGSKYAELISAYLLLAPAISPNAPTTRKSDSNGYVQVSMPKIICLSLLNLPGIRAFNHLPIININKPKELLHGTETLQLSYRLAMSRMPRMKYEKDLRKITQPALVLVGEEDELFHPEQFEPLLSQYTPAKTKIIAKANHDGILHNEETFKEVETWMKSLC